MAKVSLVEKFFTKENIIIVAFVFYALIQSNYFATKLDVANIKLELAMVKQEIKEYSDHGDKELQKNIEEKFNQISIKLDKLK